MRTLFGVNAAFDQMAQFSDCRSPLFHRRRCSALALSIRETCTHVHARAREGRGTQIHRKRAARRRVEWRRGPIYRD